MKKILASLALLALSALGYAQTYPSPTYQGITIRGITGLQLDNGTSAASAYGGTSCTNQFPRSLNSSGAATCSSVALTSDVSGTLPVSSGGTGAGTASGTSLDNITGFSSTGFLTRTGVGTYAFQSLTNGITYANLAQAAANTLLGNATGSTANVTAITVTGCNGAAQALQWTNGSGFGCNSNIATSGANANITSLTGLTTPLSVSQGGSGTNTHTAHGVLVGEGTAAVVTLPVGTTGQVLVGSTGADPAFGSTVGALTFTGAITPTSTAGIVGTTTNDNANAGSVGEFPSPTNLTNVSATSGTPVNVASIPLNAGDWEVSGVGQFNPAGSTTSSLMLCGTSNTSGVRGSFGSEQVLQLSFPAGQGEVISSPPTRFSLASTTTIYEVCQAIFSTSTMTISGFIRARRVR